MKKRILTLLLAGLMAMSAVACNEPTENPNLTTDPNGTSTTEPVVDEFGYQIVNETVYSVSETLALREEANTSKDPTLTLGFGVELTRTRYKVNWSVVTYEDKDYYVESKYVTTDDIGIKTFTLINPAQTMHATKQANVRYYPTSLDFKVGDDTDNIYKELEMQDNVTVVGQNKSWYQILMDGKKLYVAKSHLAEGKVASKDDLGDFEAKFAQGAYNPYVTMYVNTPGSSAKVRSYPSTESFSVEKAKLTHATPITVVAVAKMTDGYQWAKVIAPEDSSDPYSSTVSGYVRCDLLSGTKVADNTNLDSILEVYNLTEYPQNVAKYVAKDAGGLSLRITPGKEHAAVGGLEANQKVIAVAYGTGENAGWILIEYTIKETKGWYFVSAQYLTDAEGQNAKLGATSYEAYAGFTAVTGTPTKTVTTGAYVFLTPDIATANQKGQLAANTTVKVIAQGSYSTYSVYFVQDTVSGEYWFIDQYKVN